MHVKLNENNPVNKKKMFVYDSGQDSLHFIYIMYSKIIA